MLGLCGIPSIWRSPTTRQPRGSASTEPSCAVCLTLPSGCPVVALGEVEGMPHPAQPGPAAAVLVAGYPGDLPARRGHGPSDRQDLLGDQAGLLITAPKRRRPAEIHFVGRRHVSSLRVVSSAETAHRRPRCGTRPRSRRVRLGGDGVCEGLRNAAWRTESGDGRSSDKPWCRWCSGWVGDVS